jgi:hypothetical protein
MVKKQGPPTIWRLPTGLLAILPLTIAIAKSLECPILPAMAL